MQELSQLVQSLVIIVMLAVFLELLLPVSTMRSYVKMVMGLLVVIAVLQVIFRFMHSDFHLQVPEISATPVSPLAEVQANAQKITEHYKHRAVEDYKDGIAKQVLALARLNQDLTVLSAEVEVATEENDYGKLQYIRLVVTDRKVSSNIKEVEKVDVTSDTVSQPTGSGEQPPLEKQKAMEKIASTVADFYNLSKEQVQVIYTK